MVARFVVSSLALGFGLALTAAASADEVEDFY